jgi:hypothetical protein
MYRCIPCVFFNCISIHSSCVSINTCDFLFSLYKTESIIILIVSPIFTHCKIIYTNKILFIYSLWERKHILPLFSLWISLQPFSMLTIRYMGVWDSLEKENFIWATKCSMGQCPRSLNRYMYMPSWNIRNVSVHNIYVSMHAMFFL